jgi:hypothetical protein
MQQPYALGANLKPGAKTVTETQICINFIIFNKLNSVKVPGLEFVLYHFPILTEWTYDQPVFTLRLHLKATSYSLLVATWNPHSSNPSAGT